MSAYKIDFQRVAIANEDDSQSERRPCLVHRRLERTHAASSMRMRPAVGCEQSTKHEIDRGAILLRELTCGGEKPFCEENLHE